MSGEPGREPLTLRSHLRMEGRWSIAPAGPEHWPRAAGVSVRAVLANNDWTAIGTWLGLLDLVPTAAEPTLIGHLGPDVMAADFPGSGRIESIRRLAQRPETAIGAALLDQTNVAGIGTMYMAETLFLEGISPWTRTADVDVGGTLDTARRLLAEGGAAGIADDDRQSTARFQHLRPRAVRQAVPTMRSNRPGGFDRGRHQGADGVLLSGLPARADSDRRRPGAATVGCHDQYRENRRPSGYRRNS